MSASRVSCCRWEVYQYINFNIKPLSLFPQLNTLFYFLFVNMFKKNIILKSIGTERDFHLRNTQNLFQEPVTTVLG